MEKDALLIWTELSQVFQEEVYLIQSICHWLCEFRTGHETLVDLPRSGRPSTAHTEENVEGVLDAVTSDRCKTIADIAMEMQLSHSSVCQILHKDLKLRKKCAKFIPKILTPVHLQARIQTSRDFLQWIRAEPHLLDKVITEHESYMHSYIPESKQQSRQWLEPGDARPQKALQGRGTRHSKCMLVIFFDAHGIVYREYFQNQTIMAQVYLGNLQHLFTAIQHRRTASWRRRDFVLHDDNAPAHKANLVQNWLGRSHVRMLDHPAYSPDLAPCNFCFSQNQKNAQRN